MDLAVLILSYNHPQITSRCIKSVYPKFTERSIFVIHNGSELKNIELLKSEFPSINHILVAQNKGFSGGANFGLVEVLKSHDWVLFLTNDCVLHQINTNKLIHTCPLPALVAPTIYRRNLDRMDSIGGIFIPRNGALVHNKEIGSETKSVQKSKKYCDVIPRSYSYVPGTAFLIHKEVFNLTGGFDENLGTYWEDVDFSVRAHQNGVSIQTTQDVQIIHSVGKTCHKNPYYTTYLFNRNRAQISRKYVHTKFDRMNLEIELIKTLAKQGFKKLKQRKWSGLRLLLGSRFFFFYPEHKRLSSTKD